MEWYNEDVLLLIQEYQKHKLLWDPKHQWHFHKIKKADAWDDIAKGFGVDVEEVKRKIASLLGSFRRERAKGKKTIGTGKGAKEVYKTNWFAFKSLLFLIDKDDPRTTINSETTSNDNDDLDEPQNISLDSPEPTVSENSLKAEQLSPETLSQASESDTNIAGTSNKRSAESKNFTKPKAPKQKKVKKQANVEDPLIEQAFQFIQQSVPEDSTMIYAQYVANKLKQFKGRTRALVEHGINQLIFEAEMGKYDSVPPHTYSPAFLNISTHSLLSQTSLTNQH